MLGPSFCAFSRLRLLAASDACIVWNRLPVTFAFITVILSFARYVIDGLLQWLSANLIL